MEKRKTKLHLRAENKDTRFGEKDPVPVRGAEHVNETVRHYGTTIEPRREQIAG